MTNEDKPLFRVGGVYRQQNGVICELRHFLGAVSALAERVWSPPGEWLNAGGSRDMRTGRYHGAALGDDELTLIPGELELRDGQWVAVEEKEEAKSVQSLGALLRQALERGIGQTKTPTLDKLENTSEPKRAPLDWNKSTPFDPFKGFVVKSNEGWAFKPAASPLTLSTDLEPASHQVRAAFGSADLLR
jgi:hypothetical protein